jgi:hypothetical protein
MTLIIVDCAFAPLSVRLPPHEAERLVAESPVGGLGHVGASLHPVRDSRPSLLGDLLDDLAEGPGHLGRDGKAHACLLAGPDHLAVVEARVAPELSGPFAPAALTRLKTSAKKLAAPLVVWALPPRWRTPSTSAAPEVVARSGWRPRTLV